MISYTLDNLKRTTEQNNLYDLFKTTIVDSGKLQKQSTFVQKGEEMRLDLVSKRIYGTVAYEEELMILNNIILPYSIKDGDEIYFLPVDSIDIMHQLEKDDEQINVDKKSPKNNKNTKYDPNRTKGVIPTITPLNYKSVTVDKKAQKIKINNKMS